MLSSQAIKPGTGRSAGVLGTHAAKRGAGKSKSSTYKLTKDDIKKDKEDAGSALDLAPRKAAKKGKGRENADGYQDRSESRRMGKDDESNEFKAAEKLAEDFERRAREEGQDEEAVRLCRSRGTHLMLCHRSQNNANTSAAMPPIPSSSKVSTTPFLLPEKPKSKRQRAKRRKTNWTRSSRASKRRRLLK